ncbi:MAG: chemotaxis protein CheW [Pseudomonadota bacterium]|nr:chemotaxis protein CheW [Pseudomonadota bacterium]
MAESIVQVSSLLLPMRGFNLVLPHANIAEVLQGVEFESSSDDIPWLVGSFEWRGIRIPVVSFETLCGRESGPTGKAAACVVVYGLEGIGDLQFYALELQALPRPMVLDADRVESVSDDSGDRNAFVAQNVLVAGQPGIIPELAGVERGIVADRLGG